MPTTFVIAAVLLLKVIEELVDFVQAATVTLSPSMLDVTATWYLMHRHTVLLGLVLHLIKTSAHTYTGDVANALVMVPWAQVRVRTDEGCR